MRQDTPPGFVPGITYKKLHQILRQLEQCGYRCAAGTLEKNSFYIELQKLGKYKVEDRDGTADQSA